MKVEKLDWLQAGDEAETTEESLRHTSNVIGTNADISIDSVAEVDAINIGDVYDTYGRLGDSCNSAGKTYGIACIPFDLLNLPNYTKSIQGYTIQAICDKLFAMDDQPRADKVQEYSDDILQCLHSGVDYVKNLAITADGHKTYDLTYAECAIIFSKFKTNKHSLATDANGDIIMKVSVALC